MTITQTAPPASLARIGETTCLAVSYLRVSTKEQAERGGRDEGFSIPAQREANLRKARELDSIIVEEFVDAGESARKADRPDLIRMIEYVKTHHVAYCIVHKVDRLARNRADDVAIHLALKDAGVMLVSATENIDETPSGMLLHGIMSTIAEFYSRNLANEVAKGMNQKALTGGTNGKAPIGYLNVRKRDELGREMRVVEPDPDRAALVKWAFEAYAAGNYSTITLHEELVDRGLTSVPTPRRPSKAPALSTIQKMLTNPYYKGQVSFRGASYDGLHEPLVATEVWYRVQAVLTAHQTSGEKTQAHDQYLKGSIFCGECGSRLILSNARSSQGVIYPYFLCAGRHSKRTTCERKAMFVPDIEAAVEDYYRRVQIPEHIITALRELVTAEFDRLHATARHERHAYQGERDALRDERKKLLQAHYAGVIPLDLLGEEQARIARRLAFLDAQIEAGDIEYDQAKAHLEDCLALAGDCHAIYMSIDDSLRRLANQAFFDKLTVAPDDTVSGEPGEPFNILFDPSIHRTALARQHDATESGRQTGNVVGLNNDVLVDLDGFKLVNDGLGHQAGDEVLVTIAHRFQHCLRSSDTIARLGGDEFAVLLENTTGPEAVAVAEQLLTALRRPVRVKQHAITPDASVGIALSTGRDTAESMLRNADLAMYAAKDAGKGVIEVFRAAMHDSVLQRLIMDSELRRAVEQEQFTVYYQPTFSLVTGRLCGFEALLRWRHPSKGEIPPCSFIPLAESTGLIVPLGRWVLEQACRQAARWRTLVGPTDPLLMSVNLSVRQLHDPGLLEVVRGALGDAELEPGGLQLEITESIFDQRNEIVGVLDELHRAGVKLAIDDFGTGYSSLSRLHILPIDRVKVDRSFVELLADGNPAPLVAATISMAHSLGMQTTAEGIESADQLPLLRLYGCDDAQGYHFGRPMTAAAATAVIREHQAGRRRAAAPPPVGRPPVG